MEPTRTMLPGRGSASAASLILLAAVVVPLAACRGGGAKDVSDGRGGAGGDAGAKGQRGGAGVGGGVKGGAGGTVEVDAGAPVAGAGPDAASAFYRPCPAGDVPCKILPFGDSITVGITTNLEMPVGGYRVQLFGRLLSAGRNATFVGTSIGGDGPNGPDMVDGKVFPKDHEGHNGWTIDEVNRNGYRKQGLTKLVDTVFPKTQPHIVLLMVGTNDLLHVESEPDKAPERLAILIDKIIAAAPAALLVVAQVVPTQRLDDKDNDADTNLRVQAYNAQIPALIKQRADAGKHIVGADMYAAFFAGGDPFDRLFTPDPGLSPPGKIHPNAEGYKVIGNTFFESLKPHVQ